MLHFLSGCAVFFLSIEKENVAQLALQIGYYAFPAYLIFAFFLGINYISSIVTSFRKTTF